MKTCCSLKFMSVFFVSVFLSCVFTANVWADFFKYKDDAGSIVITNSLEDVPAKYRKRVKVVWDKDLEAKDPLARKWAVAESQREEQQRNQLQQPKQKTGGLKVEKNEKRLVITVNEETGELIRSYE